MRIARVGPHRARRLCGQTGADGRPVRAPVVRDERVRRVVAQQMTIDHGIRGPGHERRGRDRLDAAVAPGTGRRDVVPAPPAVAREMHESIVAPGPDLAARLGRRFDVEQRPGELRAGHVEGERTSGGLLVRLVVARKVGRDRLPVFAAIARREHNVGAEIRRRRVERIEGDRGIPVIAIASPVELELVDGATAPRLHERVALRLAVVDRDAPGLQVGPDQVGIARIGPRPHPVAAGHAVPRFVDDPFGVEAVRRPAKPVVVLEPDADPIRRAIVVADVVDLPDREIS